MARFSDLPPEVAMMIFALLGPSDIRNVQIASERFAEIMEDPVFCKEMCKKNNVIQVDKEKQSLRCEQLMKNCEESSIHQDLWDYYLKLNQNWLEKPFGKLKNFILSPLYAYLNVVYLDEKVMVVVKSNHRQSNQFCMEIRNNYNMKTIDRFRIPGTYDKCSNVSRQLNLIVVGVIYENCTRYGIIVRNFTRRNYVWKTYFDSTVDPRNYLPGVTYFQVAVHEHVIAIEISSKQLITIMFLIVGIEKFHIKCEEIVVYLKFYKEKLVLIKGVVDKIVEIWNIEKETMEYSFLLTIPTGMSWAVEQWEEYMVFYFHSPNNFEEKIVHTFKFNENRFLYATQCRSLLPLLVKNNRVVCMESDRCLRMLNCCNGNLVTTINDDSEDIFFTISANSKFLISASKRDQSSSISKFKIFDFYTGNFVRSLSFTNEIIRNHSVKLMKSFVATETLVVMHYNKNFSKDVLNSEIFYLNFEV